MTILQTKFHSSFQRQSEVNETTRGSTVQSNAAPAVVQNNIKRTFSTCYYNKMSMQPTGKKPFTESHCKNVACDTPGDDSKIICYDTDILRDLQ